MKIRTRLIATAFAALISMWIGMAAITAIGRASNREMTINLMEEYTQGLAASISSFFGDAIDAASYLAAVQGEARLGWDGEQGGGHLFARFASLKDTINSASFIDLDGYIYDAYKGGPAGNPWQGGRRTQNDSLPDAEPISVSDREFFRALVAENARGEFRVMVSEPCIPRGSTEKNFIISAPVVYDGRPAGIANVTQTTEELSRLYVELAGDLEGKFGSNAHLFLFSDGGQIVSELRYDQEAGAYRDALGGMSEIVYLDSLESDYVAALSAAAAASDAITATMHGEAHFLMASKIEGTPLAVCLAASRSTMLSSSRAMLIVGIISFLAVTFAMLIGINITMRAMRFSLDDMDSTMHGIAKEWDLTARVKVMGNDEIAAIAESINQFVDAISGMIGSVSNSARGMSDTGESLSESAALISLDISSIEKDIDNLNLAVDAQRTSVDEVSSIITQIVHNIEGLSSQIESQSQDVTDSSAAVRQMVSSIQSISENASGASASFGELKLAASDGRGSISSVQELVSKLSAQSDSLLEANNVIKAVASQTNLLAMNAAIEAAHAGDAGKGFSVVAEEIRKLSENSASQSKAIAAGLKDTIAAIDNIARATAKADAAFGIVAAKIGDVTELVSSLVSSINLATSKQNAGGRHVLEALREIEIITAQIRDEAVMMNDGTEKILKEILRLSGVSQKVQARSASIANAAETIGGELEEIVMRTISNSEAIDMLVGVTERFRL